MLHLSSGEVEKSKTDVSLFSYKRRKVSAVRTFPSDCGRNAPRVNRKVVKDGENKEECGRNVVPELYKVRDVSATRSFPVGCGRNAPRINGELEKDGVLVGDVENSKVEKDGACVESSQEVVNPVEDAPQAVRLDTHDDVPIGRTKIELEAAVVEPTFGSSLLPKPLVPKNTNIVEVLVEIETLEPMEALKPMLEDSKCLDMAEHFELKITRLSEDTSLAGTCGPKNSDGPESRDLLKNASQPKKKDLPSSFVQLPEDSILSENGVQHKVSNQPHTVDRVEDEEDSMHQKYPRRRVSACRDFPPCCAINSRSIMEDNTLRDPSVCNEGASGNNDGKDSDIIPPHYPISSPCSIVEVDSFKEPSVVNEDANGKNNGEQNGVPPCCPISSRLITDDNSFRDPSVSNEEACERNNGEQSDIPPRCPLNSPCSIVGVDSFRGPSVCNEEASGKNNGEQSDMPPRCLINSICSIIEVDSFREPSVGNEGDSGRNNEEQSDIPPCCPINSPCSIVEVDAFRESRGGNEEACGRSNGEDSDDVIQNVEKIEDEDTFESREHVHVRVVSETKLKQEDLDEARIQSPLETIISQSDLNTTSSSKKSNGESEGSRDKVGMELVKCKDFSLKKNVPRKSGDESCTNQSQTQENVGLDNKRVIVQALMAASNSEWNLVKVFLKSPSGLNHATAESKGKKHQLVLQDDSKSISGRKKVKVKASEEKCTKKKMTPVKNVSYEDERQLALVDNNDYIRQDSEYCSSMFQSQLEGHVELESSNKRVIVQALCAAPNCPWNRGKQTKSPNGLRHAKMERKGKKQELAVQGNSKSISRRRKIEVDIKGTKKKKSTAGNVSYKGAHQLALVDEDEYYNRHDKEGHSLFQTSHNMELSLVPFGVHPIVDKDDGNEVGVTALPLAQISHNIDLSLIPFGIQPFVNKDTDKEAGVTRKTVRETLRLFQGIVRKLLHDEESKSKDFQVNGSRRSRSKGVKTNDAGRFDLLAGKILKDSQRWVNTGKPILGNVPGVEIGDEFHYRVELAIIGLHRPFQGGIDYLKEKMVATSVVASGGYADVMDNSNILVYSGQGGMPKGDKKAEDQKLERGNLSLKNSIDEGTPVRVIRGFKETKGNDSLDSRGKGATTYVYDGLYFVESYWEETGGYGTNVFKFQLRRMSGQPELAIKEVKKFKKSRVREGLCVDDISQGKEKKAIGAINIVDDQKPPSFEYITNMIYPSWYNLMPPKGCDCIDGCSDSEKCLCAIKNGGEIPFNYDGAIVEAKPLVYECGPSCGCPPSCYNRVSQHGIKFRLEIFKTESRGWGVRSLTSIPSGSFVCQYTGELLQDEEAEKRENDEYLFDIGHNYNDEALWEGLSNPLPINSLSSSSCEVVEDEGFTIDAAQYGSVGRFVNHSCSPNLYAQNVLYDHDDKRMPHIMLFAAENIPPLQELTYHYNYELGQVRDSDGNVKEKNCYCGSLDCTGRMY